MLSQFRSPPTFIHCFPHIHLNVIILLVLEMFTFKVFSTNLITQIKLYVCFPTWCLFSWYFSFKMQFIIFPHCHNQVLPVLLGIPDNILESTIMSVGIKICILNLTVNLKSNNVLLHYAYSRYQVCIHNLDHVYTFWLTFNFNWVCLVFQIHWQC